MATSRSTRLTGRRLIALRWLWAMAVIGGSMLYLLDLIVLLQDGSTGPNAPPVQILLGAYYMALSLLLFWRRTDDWVAFVVSLSLMVSLTTGNLEAFFGAGPFVERVDLILQALGSVLLLLMFYVFPDGRFVPGWTRWSALAVTGVQLWRIFFEAAYMAYGFGLMGLLLITVPIALIYRYFRASDAVQRQQIKWIVFAVAVTAPGVVLGLVLYSLQWGPMYEQIGLFAWSAFLAAVPLSLTFSILRYRLWDIDVIIRKTLLYAMLSGMLALVYFGSVVLLQSLVGQTAAEQSPLIIVVSTLLIAALFSPLRQRVQTFIDRRFYRRKYNAEQMLAGFAQTTRAQVELGELTVALLRVVEQSVQPAAVSVWLREQEKESASAPGG